MATVVLTAVGTAIAGPFGGLVGGLVGQGLDALIFGSHSSRSSEGPRLSDLSVQTASYGEPVPMVFGTVRLSGNVIWSQGLIETRHEDSEKVGGKGSSQTVTTVTYTYSSSFAVGLSARCIHSVGRIWADGKLLRDENGQMATAGTIRIYRGDPDQDPDPLIEAVEGVEAASAFRGLAYVMFEGLELAEYANRIPNLTFEVIAEEAGSIMLSELVEELCFLAGLEKVEAGDLSREVSGYVLSGRFRPREALEKLAELYDFDLVEQGDGLLCRPLGRQAGEDIPASQLLRPEGGEGGSPLRVIRDQELSLPREITVSYLDVARDYQAGLQRAFRQTGGSELTEQKQAPLVLNSNDAKEKAECLLENRWRRRERIEFMLPPGFCRMAPGDVVRLSLSDSQYGAVILETELSARGVRVLAMKNGEPLPARDISADTGAIPGQQVVPLATSRLVLADLPSPDDEDPHGVYLFAAVNALGAGYWPGAAIYLSRDVGGHMEKQFSAAIPAVTGMIENALGEGPLHFPDYTSRLLVRLDHAADVLESRLWREVLNGANMVVVGGEILQFAAATLVEPGLYELSILLRGRRGTEDRVLGHVAGEPFILLSHSSLLSLPLLLSDTGRELSFAALTIGQSIDDIEYQPKMVEGRSLKPFSPVHVRGRRDDQGNLEIRWVRRSRFGGGWRDGQDVPVGEAYEKYVTEILLEGQVVRTLECVTPEVIYAATDQLTDFSELPAQISLRIFQISDTVGRGIPAEVIL
ncbi:phage tail protein [Emcibacter sp.]|uniref:phage tail protein n=1 Tax=Emcibacter sp. TaxID=1979954 RepID=UPI003A93D3EA